MPLEEGGPASGREEATLEEGALQEPSKQEAAEAPKRLLCQLGRVRCHRWTTRNPTWSGNSRFGEKTSYCRPDTAVLDESVYASSRRFRKRG